MAPGRRKTLIVRANDVDTNQPPEPTPIVDANAGDIVAKKVRGKTRGVGCEKLLQAAQAKLPIVFSKEDGVPTGVNASKLSTEIGIVARHYAPIRVLTWKKVPSDVEKQMIARITTKFDININEPHVLKWLKHTMGKRFNGFKNKLHKKFKMYASKEEAYRHRPEEIKDQDDWKFLCDHFASEQFQAQQLGDLVSPIQLFHDTRWSVEKGWINEEAKKLYEKMLELQDETQAGDSEKTEAQICEEVLGRAYGFNRNYAFCESQQSDTVDASEFNRTIEQQQKRIQDLEDQLVLFNQQKDKIKLLEEQHEAMLHMLTQITKATAHAQPATTPNPVPPYSPTDDESSSSASAASKASHGLLAHMGRWCTCGGQFVS